MGMALKQILKRSINKLLSYKGYTIVKIDTENKLGTMEMAFHRIAQRKHFFRTVIDVGASNGNWSSSLMRYYPFCQYLLIEAQPVHEQALKQFVIQHNNAQFVLSAAGDHLGLIYFDATDPFGGQAAYAPYEVNNIQVPVTTIDHEIQARQLQGPYLIKLDTHGFEIPILNGALETLHETEVIIMECYNFKIAPQCLLFYEICEYLKKSGFRCIDLVDVLHRPYDHSLWQMDLVFIKDTRPEFLYLGYK